MNHDLMNSLPQAEWEKLIDSIVVNFTNLEDIDDLRQEAWLEIIKASDQFDPNRGVKFSTLACTYIRNKMLAKIASSTRRNGIKNIEDHEIEESVNDYVESCDLIETVFDKVDSEKNARLLYDYFLEDNTLKTIASKENVSSQAINMRIHKLLDVLKVRLQSANA
jgi:RNA polymerase sigma factor (sigma-70 family)